MGHWARDGSAVRGPVGRPLGSVVVIAVFLSICSNHLCNDNHTHCFINITKEHVQQHHLR